MCTMEKVHKCGWAAALLQVQRSEAASPQRGHSFWGALSYLQMPLGIRLSSLRHIVSARSFRWLA